MPYVGEIRMFAGNFAPNGWALCNGGVIPISENSELFNLIGTTYGGDGVETFALPDLQGRLPMHAGNSHTLGEMGGVESVTLTVNQIPPHTHTLFASQDAAVASDPVDNVPAAGTTISLYKALPPDANLHASAITATGGSQPHSNLQAYVCINFIISLFGVIPT